MKVMKRNYDGRRSPWGNPNLSDRDREMLRELTRVASPAKKYEGDCDDSEYNFETSGYQEPENSEAQNNEDED